MWYDCILNFHHCMCVCECCRADCSTLGDSVNSTSALRSTCLLSPSQRIGVYTVTTLVSVVLNFARAVLFYFICLRASYILHNHMFSSVLRTFVQFFDNNPAGKVLCQFLNVYLNLVFPLTRSSSQPVFQRCWSSG